ncbi:hypothetical protein BH11BAC7_BH11BAC7_11580 [soil metagenome]
MPAAGFTKELLTLTLPAFFYATITAIFTVEHFSARIKSSLRKSKIVKEKTKN